MKNHFEKNRSAILADYFNLLRFPTVGTDPARLRDCVQCALWIRDWLKPLGFAGELIQAEGMAGAPPVLFAERALDAVLETHGVRPHGGEPEQVEIVRENRGAVFLEMTSHAFILPQSMAPHKRQFPIAIVVKPI